MASTGAIFAVIALIIVILGAGALALLYLYPNIGRAAIRSISAHLQSRGCTRAPANFSNTDHIVVPTNIEAECCRVVCKILIGASAARVIRTSVEILLSKIYFY